MKLLSSSIWLPLLSRLIYPTLAGSSHIAPVAWWTGKGPALAYQEANGNIIYSPCNLDGTVWLSRDASYVLDTPGPPKTGTKLAAVGWIDEGKHLWV